MKIKSLLALSLVLGIYLFSCNTKLVPAEVSGGKIKPYDTATFNYIYVEAIKEKLLGNGGDALKLLEHAARINPESDAAYFQIAQILIANGDLNNGKKYALKAWQYDQKNFWYLMMLAGAYYQEKDLDSAILFYDKAVINFPEKEGLQVTLANLYSEDGKFDKAARIFRSMDEKYGINEASSAGLLKNLMWEEKWDEAMERAQILIKEYPDVILYNGLLAEIYRGKGEPEKAMEVYQMLIDRNPGNPDIQLAICDFLIEEKRYEELTSLLRTVIINENISRSDKVSLFGRMIETPEIAKEGGNSLILSVMLLEVSYGNDDLILMIRPELLIAQGKQGDAIKRLEEIIGKRPENYYAWEKLLLILFQKSEFVKLEEKAEECAARFNRSFLAKILYATAATENGNYDIAFEELRKAEILAGNNDEMVLQVLTIKADIYYRSRDFENAFKTFDEAISKNKDDLTLLNNYAYYLAEQNMRLREAEEMAKKVVSLDKTNDTFLDTYAWVLYKRGKYREAGKIMEGILRNTEKKDAEYYEHYGYILKKRHDCRNAVISWENAIKMDSTKISLVKEIETCKK
jgi:tetratricopeptide (TPR) repeat protein